MKEKKNLLFFIADQLRGDSLGVLTIRRSKPRTMIRWRQKALPLKMHTAKTRCVFPADAVSIPDGIPTAKDTVPSTICLTKVTQA